MQDPDETRLDIPGEGTEPSPGIDERPPSEPQPRIPHYRIIRLIQRGGMGSVYLAEHSVLARTVALKVIRPNDADPDFEQRFLREARAAATIEHPNLVRVHDAGIHQGTCYLAMTHLAGGDLGSSIDQDGPLSEHDALHVGLRICAALGELHRAGIVHRDVKPENILLDEEARPVLVDLGSARTATGADRLTQTGAALGTPAYMAPEQAAGHSDIDARADIYALGASLFTLIAGRPPFIGPTSWATVAAHLHQEVPDPRKAAPAISDGAAAVIYHCLQKDPATRYQSTADLAADLQAVLGGGPPRKAPPLPPRPAAALRGEPARLPWAATMAAVVLGALLALIIAALLEGQAPARAPQAAPPPIAPLEADPLAILRSDQTPPERGVAPTVTLVDPPPPRPAHRDPEVEPPADQHAGDPSPTPPVAATPAGVPDIGTPPPVASEAPPAVSEAPPAVSEAPPAVNEAPPAVNEAPQPTTAMPPPSDTVQPPRAVPPRHPDVVREPVAPPVPAPALTPVREIGTLPPRAPVVPPAPPPVEQPAPAPVVAAPAPSLTTDPQLPEALLIDLALATVDTRLARAFRDRGLEHRASGNGDTRRYTGSFVDGQGFKVVLTELGITRTRIETDTGMFGERRDRLLRRIIAEALGDER